MEDRLHDLPCVALDDLVSRDALIEIHEQAEIFLEDEREYFVAGRVTIYREGELVAEGRRVAENARGAKSGNH